jgi:hypothetical protein
MIEVAPDYREAGAAPFFLGRRGARASTNRREKTLVEHRIHLPAATERDYHPRALYGRFMHDELTACIDGATCRAWLRRPRETPECFERRIVRELVQAADLRCECLAY